MAGFNYSKFHYFDKFGTELMLKKTTSVRIEIINKDYSDCCSEYVLVMENPSPATASLLKTKSGSRYKGSEVKANVYFSSGEINTVIIPSQYYTWISYTSSKGKERYPELVFDSLNAGEKSNFLSLIGVNSQNTTYPSMTFEGNLMFDKVSTELIETQSLYVLVETDSAYNNNFGIHGMVDVASYASTNSDAKNYIDKYELLFFIDCRDQKDFRFFTVDGDDVVWSDRHYINMNNGRMFGSDNGFRVDIGFSGEMEGVYEQKLYVCLFEKATSTVTVIGTLTMNAETEGEDERYRAFFANFGLPSLDEIEPAFRETNINEDLPDHISRNRHAKKLFLSYSEIFPYAGTYKALANAVKLLGYEDIFFKEWYKDIGNPTPDDDGYVAFDVVFGSNSSANTINSKPIEERIHLRKMNWLSIVYRLNEKVGKTEDKWGFPGIKENINYYNTDNLVKLLSLRDWLDKYIVGINCRITDIGGEGIVFERYNTLKFGQYQQVFDYTNEKSLSLTINNGTETIIDGSANISVNVNTSSQYDTIEEFKGKRFIDICTGYFNEKSKFISTVEESLIDDNRYVYFSKTFDLHNNMDSFELRAKGILDSFRFSNDEFIFDQHPQLIIDDGKMMFNPYDLIKKPKNSAFTNLPVISLTQARIKRYKKNMETYGELSYDASVYVNDEYKIVVAIHDFEADIQTKYKFDEDITLIPPTSSELTSSISIKPRFSPKTSRSKNGPFSIYGERPVITVPFDNRTYGLRFSSDTLSGDPVLMIAGYECPQAHLYHNLHFPLTNQTENDEPYEYFIEILNGSLIFNDPENDRKISINFEFDGFKKNIYVTTFQYKKQFTLYEYKISDGETTDRFMNGKEYSDFVSGYLSDPEEYVKFDVTRYVNVLNAGTYNVDAIIYDEYNNMFHASANTHVNVVTPDIDASTYTIDSSARTDYYLFGTKATEKEALSMSDIGNDENNRCIYEYVPKYNILSRNGIDFEISGIDSYQESNIDDGTEFFRNDASLTYAQLTNTTERFIFIGSYNILNMTVLSFIRRSFKSEITGPVGINEYNDIARAAHIQRIESPNDGLTIDQTLYNFQNVSVDLESQGSYADVMVMLYDESCEYPLYCYPGVCLPTRNYGFDENYKFDEYRVIFDRNVISHDDLVEFMDCASLPSVTVYIIPAWSLRCKLNDTDSSVVSIQGYTFTHYPFEKNLVKNDSYKILFINGNDGPEEYTEDSSYEYTVRRVYLDYIGKKTSSSYQDSSYTDYYYYSGYKSNLDSSTLEENYFDIDSYSKRIKKGSKGLVYCTTAENTPVGVSWKDSETTKIYGVLAASYDTMGYEYLVKNYNQFYYSVYITSEANQQYSWIKLKKTYPAISNAYAQSVYHVVNQNDALVKLDASLNERYGTDASMDAVLFIGHAARDYSEFILPVSDEDSNFGTGQISLKNTGVNRDISYYLDTTYTASFRNFNVRNGIDLWKEIDKDKIMEMYSYNCPVSTQGNEILLVPILSEEYRSYVNPMDIIMSENYTTKWKVFRQHGNSKHSLLFECYNKILSLTFEEKGSYDVDLTIYDKHGNKYNKFLIGAITIE